LHKEEKERGVEDEKKDKGKENREEEEEGPIIDPRNLDNGQSLVANADLVTVEGITAWLNWLQRDNFPIKINTKKQHIRQKPSPTAPLWLV
jgi:hypothetical protein